MARQQAITIVLATDDLDHAQMLQQTLQHAHITNPLLVFSEVQAVLDYLSRTGVRLHEAPPVLLLLDPTLRHDDGTDLLTHLQANDHTRHLPMMLLCSTDMVPETMPVAARRERIWVSKPVTPARFAEALRTLGLFLAVVMPHADTVYSAS